MSNNLKYNIKTFIYNYVNLTINELNIFLDNPAKLIKEKALLKMDFINGNLKRPLNFMAVLLFTIANMLIYRTICNIIFIIYYIYYRNNYANSLEKIKTLNRYLTIICLILILENAFNNILKWLYFYNHIKIIIMYILVRNDFSYSNMLFGLMKKYYNIFKNKIQIKIY